MNSAIVESHEIKMKLRQKFSFLFDIRSLFYYFWLLVFVCCCFFLTSLLSEHGTTPFTGDYAQQAYAFYYNAYDDWWTFFKTGKFPLYDANSFLGADNIQSNTYYGLFTPFLVILLMFPRSFLPNAMTIMTFARLICGALLFRLYLKKMGAKESTARIFSIAYAFMGWSTFYLWFSTFMEVVAFLPLILLGIEYVIKDRKIWVVALGFFFIGVGNYFFLLTFGIFGVIYALFRFFQTRKERKGIEHLQVIEFGFIGFLLGILMCAAVTFPALLSSFKINRAETSKYLPNIVEALKSGDVGTVFKNIFTVWSPYVVNYNYPASWYYFCYSFPLVSYLFPAVSGRYVNIVGFHPFENIGTSIFVFTPCLLLMLPSLIRSFKNKKVSHFIALFIFICCLFTPFIYWLSGAFANAYGRWTIVVSTTMLTYVALNFDHREEFKNWHIALSGLIAILMMVAALLLANKLGELYKQSSVSNEYVGGNWSWIFPYDEIVPVIVYQFIMIGLGTIIFFFLQKPKLFKIHPIIVGLFFVVEVIVQGNAYINFHGITSIDTEINWGTVEYNKMYSIVNNINENDKSFFRMNMTKADEYHPNMGFALNYNGSSMFHSFYNTELDDFIHWNGMTWHETSWSALDFLKNAYLEEFLGMKYYITQDAETSYNDADGNIVVTYEPSMPLNYENTGSVNGYRVYKNTKQINFGMSYDTLYYKHRRNDKIHNDFYTSGTFADEQLIRNAEMLFKGAILNDEDLKEIVSKHPSLAVNEGIPSISARHVNGAELTGTIYYSKEQGRPDFNPANPLGDITKDNIYIPGETPNVSITQLQIAFKPRLGKTFPIGEKGGFYMLDYPIAKGNDDRYDAAVWAVSEDNRVICFDDARYNSSSFGGTFYRTIYSKTPIKYFIVCPLNLNRGTLKYTNKMNVYYQKWEDVEARFDEALANDLDNVIYDTNKAIFTSSYDKERFVCLQVAYLDGWKLKAKVNGVEQELKTYNAQGGFLGFVAPEGNVSYELTYRTPHIILWSLVSIASGLSVLGISVLPIIIKKKKEKQSSK